MTETRIIVSRTALADGSPSTVIGGDVKVLNLVMICCEESLPYGPPIETAINFLDLICMSYARYNSSLIGSDGVALENMLIRITVYHAKSLDYPSNKQEWDAFDGVIIPGSISAAYDDHMDWINRLHTVIREEIHLNRRKTLGVCFGHQCFAHSFKNNTTEKSNVSSNVDEDHVAGGSRHGLAGKCPSGFKIGRKPCHLTAAGKCLFSDNFGADGVSYQHEKKDSKPTEVLEMLYTHGDMVETLPSNGISLGGSSEVPIHASAYFESDEKAIQFGKYVDLLAKGTSNTTRLRQVLGHYTNCHGPSSLPYSLTFQAHPEFVAPSGFNVNYKNLAVTLGEKGFISGKLAKEAWEDAQQHFEKLLVDSVNAVIVACVTLGWF